MVPERISRRRAIAIFAATAAGAAFMRNPSASAADAEWRGTAMGADARLVFSGVSQSRARAMTDDVVSEIHRLEDALSLFRPESEISRFNRSGFLQHPSLDFRRALEIALRISGETDGLFDPTVQALWDAHCDWFRNDPEADLPPEPIVRAAQAHVNWQGIQKADNEIRLGAGQRITLNGMAQGYITDRIADLLRSRGFEHVLIDLGELRALGPRTSGEAWEVDRRSGEILFLTEGALATSEGEGCRLGANGRAHHLFDPRSGRSAGKWRSITVHHASAAVADALSTGLYAASVGAMARICSRIDGLRVWATADDGAEWRWPRDSIQANSAG